MKITIVTETYRPFISGIASSTDSIAVFMSSKGHQVRIIAPKPVIPFENDHPDIKLIYTPSFKDFFFEGKPTSPWPLPLTVMEKEITREKIDVLHIQEPGSLGSTALLYAKLRKIPILGALHSVPSQIATYITTNPLNGISIKIIEAYLRYFYNKVDQIMVPTATFAEEVKKMRIKKPITPVSNGVEIEEMCPSNKNYDLMRKLNLPLDKFLLLYTGRIDRDKNLETVIKALKLLPDSVHFVVGGKGKDKESLMELSKELNVQNKISWSSFSSKEEIRKMYQSADCFVITAPFESQSIVTLEAIACGLPVIAANAGALPELVHDGINGYLVDPYDFKTISEKIIVLANDSDLRKKMGQESRQIALPHEKSKNLEKLEELYKELINLQ